MYIEDKIKENVELNDIKEYRIYKNTKSVVRKEVSARIDKML